MTFQNHIENFLDYQREVKHLSEHTCIAYHTDLLQLAEYLATTYTDLNLSNIKLLHLRSWIATMAADQKLTAKSLQRKRSSLLSFFKYQLQQGSIKVNPARQLKVPKLSKMLPNYLETEQTEQLVAQLSKGSDDDFKTYTDYLIIELLYQTGMRRAELKDLKESNINFQKNELKVLGKGNKERIIPLSSYLLKDLEAYIALKRKIFGNASNNLLSLESGKPLYDNYIYRVVNSDLKKVTTLQKKSPHIMRHTFATQILNNGGDLNAIKDLLGHSSLAATQVYTHTNISQLQEAYRKAHPKS